MSILYLEVIPDTQFLIDHDIKSPSLLYPIFEGTENNYINNVPDNYDQKHYCHYLINII